MIPLFAFAALLNFIVSLFLGVLVYLKSQGRKYYLFFILYFLAVAFWNFGYYFWQIADKADSALFWCRFLMIGAIFIPIFYLNFIIDFLKIKRNKFIILISYIYATIFIVVDFTDYFVSGVEKKLIFNFWPVAGSLYSIFLAIFAGLFCYGWYLLIRALSKAKDENEKQQLKYFLLGTAIGSLGGFTNFPLWYGVPLLPYGHFCIAIGVLFVALALFKYHLFEIKLIATEFLVGIMGVVLLIVPFLMPTIELEFLMFTVFLLFCFFSYLLIKSTHRESRLRELAEANLVQEKTLRQEAEEISENLKHLDEAKSQLMLSTQHHLRTPLAAIQGYADLILSGDCKDTREKVKKILTSSQILIKLVNDMIEMANYRIGNDVILAKQKTDIIFEVRQIIAELSPKAKEKDLVVDFIKPTIPIPLLMLDWKRLKESFFNIIDNGLNYTEKGGISIELTIKDDKLLFTIADTGIGLDETEKKELFSRTFERGHEAKEMYCTGKGIGLYLAAQMIISSGGTIRAESAGRNKGTTFFIELPIELA